MKKRFLISVIVALLIGIFASCGNATKSIDVNEYIAIAEKYLTEMKYEEAYTYFLEVIEVEPMNVRAYLGITDAQIHLGKQEESVEVLNKGYELTENENLINVAISVKNSDIEGYVALADAYIAEGLADKAEELLRRVYEETDDEIIGIKLGLVELENKEVEVKEDYVIEWADKEFEQRIREYIGKLEGDVYYYDVKDIEVIQIYGNYIRKEEDTFFGGHGPLDSVFDMTAKNVAGEEINLDAGEIKILDDIKHFDSLRTLRIRYQSNLDISALSRIEEYVNLQKLWTLDIGGNELSDISAISKLYNLKYLEINFNNITELYPISMLIELETLKITGNTDISSMEVAKGLINLETVYANEVDSIDVSVFSNCKKLKTLELYHTEIINPSMLTDLVSVERFELTLTDENKNYVFQMDSLVEFEIEWNSTATSIDGIEELSKLKTLTIRGMDSVDLSPIANLNIEELSMTFPRENDFSFLVAIDNLKVTVANPPHVKANEEARKQYEELKAMYPNIEIENY